ncbi:sugar ABC transporter substrate-binding protein, partial [Rhizobium ruizarguesonis]
IEDAVDGVVLEQCRLDGVLNVGASEADAAASGIAKANKVGKVAHGTFDLNASGLARIKDGSQNFAIDQQP